MKLNFWQILGAVVLIIGLVLLIRREMAGTTTPTPAPTVSVPATTPA
jgi:hypothetical protein